MLIFLNKMKYKKYILFTLLFTIVSAGLIYDGEAMAVARYYCVENSTDCVRDDNLYPDISVMGYSSGPFANCLMAGCALY